LLETVLPEDLGEAGACMEQISEALNANNAVSTKQHQCAPPSIHTPDFSPNPFSDSTTSDSQNDAPSIPKKKKRNQKSGAQRRKEARNRALAEAFAHFIGLQVTEINIESHTNAQEYKLSNNAQNPLGLARNVDSSKWHRDDLEKTLREALTVL
jgi:hypothetical protein